METWSHEGIFALLRFLHTQGNKKSNSFLCEKKHEIWFSVSKSANFLCLEIAGFCQGKDWRTNYQNPCPGRECSHFVQCIGGINAIETACAPGTYFNPNRGLCDHPQNTPSCGSNTQTDTGVAQPVVPNQNQNPNINPNVNTNTNFVNPYPIVPNQNTNVNTNTNNFVNPYPVFPNQNTNLAPSANNFWAGIFGQNMYSQMIPYSNNLQSPFFALRRADGNTDDQAIAMFRGFNGNFRRNWPDIVSASDLINEWIKTQNNASTSVFNTFCPFSLLLTLF